MQRMYAETFEDLKEVLMTTLSTPNEMDSNGEPANVVDGLFAIARAIERLADKVAEQPGQAVRRAAARRGAA